MTCTGQATAARCMRSSLASRSPEGLTRDLSVTSNISGAINWHEPQAIQPGSIVGPRIFLVGVIDSVRKSNHIVITGFCCQSYPVRYHYTKINQSVVGFMYKDSQQGFLITFEGIDGSGKTSAAQALYQDLVKKYTTLLTREPGATHLGKVLRTLLQGRTFSLDPKAEYLLFAADRAQHMQEIVLPALAEGIHVISDRMADSSYAYQGYGRGVDPDMIHTVNSWAMQGREPDLTIYVMITYEEARRRLGARNEQATVFEQEQEAFFERVAQGFEAVFALRSPQSIVMRVDGLQKQEHLHAEINNKVSKFLKERG